MERLTSIYAIHQTHEFSGCAQLDMSLWFPFVTWMFLLIVSAGFRSQDHNRKKWVIVFPCCSVIVESGENVAKHTR